MLHMSLTDTPTAGSPRRTRGFPGYPFPPPAAKYEAAARSAREAAVAMVNGGQAIMRDDMVGAGRSGAGLWKLVREEVREVVWLASVVGVLSVAGVALAVALAAG